MDSIIDNAIDEAEDGEATAPTTPRHRVADRQTAARKTGIRREQ